MKSSGKMWLLTILKFIKNQGFTLSLKDSTVGGGGGGTTGGSNWPTPAFCRLRIESPKCITSILVKDWDHFIFPSLSFLFSYDPSHDPQLFEKNIFEVEAFSYSFRMGMRILWRLTFANVIHCFRLQFW